MGKMKDILSTAAALYDGGWRSGDIDDIRKEYGLSLDDAEAICEWLRYFEEKNNV